MRKNFTVITLIVLTLFIMTGCGVNYEEVIIGNQIWMAKNLDVEEFRNGDPIPRVQSEEDWGASLQNEKPAWCYYNNDSTNGDKYGKLYNWYAVNDPRGLAPKGWQIPDASDWEQLAEFLGGKEFAGNKMKSTDGWKNGNGTNESGFNGLPGGRRNQYGDRFNYINNVGYWWSSTEWKESYHGTDAWYFFLIDESDELKKHQWYKSAGFSVRCIKDN